MPEVKTEETREKETAAAEAKTCSKREKKCFLCGQPMRLAEQDGGFRYECGNCGHIHVTNNPETVEEGSFSYPCKENVVKESHRKDEGHQKGR